ncbi:MAG: type I polyketide synthase [Chitinophagales bacterium]
MEDIEQYKQQIADLQHQLETIRSEQTEPIAIIGMAMRLPGKIKNEDDLWNVLINGIDCIEEIPANRWDKDALFDPDPNTPGKLYIKEGGFIEDIEYLDGQFFNVSPIELESTDPQQRILLEVAHEALENAGVDVNSLIGSDTGVFIGIDNVDYERKQLRSGDYKLINGYCYTSTGPTGASGRISYTMGLRGPCMTIDTACSSALTCTHIAAQALRNKECKIAVVGSASIITEPDQSLSFCRLGAQSPEARCKSFDDDANGYIRSEGVCIMVLKRLSDAQKDDDKILAIIKGSAVNQDGKSKRFTAPSTVAQGLMHTAALKNAQLDPTEIDYIETHGTGTKVGDPAEVRGILFAYEKFRTKENPIVISSNKSNFGHMECNSGMASIFKVILALQNNIIPKVVHLKKPNTLIDWNNIPVVVAKDNIAWNKKSGKARYAGISGFGATGSNAHVILGDVPENPHQLNKQNLRSDIFILPLSAKNEQALIDLTKSYADFIQHSNHALEDICAMASLRRAHFDLREVFTATTKEELIEKLHDFSEANNYESKKKLHANETIKTVFVFPGQGSQWINMGKTLYENELVFRVALDECNQVFKKYVDYDVIEEISKSEHESRLHEIDVVQPILIAVEIALANLWMSKGVFPDIVIGHSMGEIAAAYVAGNISLDDAAKIIITRSKLMKQLSGKGEMGATDLTIDEANELLKGYEDKLSVAVMNSKNSTVLSGDPIALNEVFAKLEAQERFNRKVKVDVASHSPQMDVIKQHLFEALETIQPKNSTIQFYSTALNQIVEGEQLNADYWTKNLRNPVQFGNAVLSVLQDAEVTFVEMSPHPILIHAVNENIQSMSANAVAISSFTRDKNELLSFYTNVGELHASGYVIDWKSIYPNIDEFVQLPNYAWQKERYWFDQKPEITTPTSIVQKDISQHLYEINWQEIKTDANIVSKNVLIIKDTYDHYLMVENALKEKGCNVTSIGLNDSLDGIHADIVIHMRSFYKESAFSFYLECGVLSLQKLINHFNKTNQYPKICVVTNGAFVLQQDVTINLNASTLTGVLRTLENEHEEISFLQIDISNEITNTELDQLASFVFAENKFKELAVRDKSVYTPTIQKNNAVIKQTKQIYADKTYLVIGGTNGLGLFTVEWLIKNNAKNITVFSRNGAKNETQTLFETHKNNGVNIQDVKVDVANLEELKDAVHAINDLAGIFYAAGILDDGAFENLTKNQFENVIHTKATGAWNMHILTQDVPLDFFVLYSSAAGIVGSAGQSNYNAANTFMDALAHFRKANHKNALSVNFGTIAEIGLAARQENRADRLTEQGVVAIKPNNLNAYFDTLFLSDATQVMAMEIDFNKWSQFNHAVLKNYFYSKVVQQHMEENVQINTQKTFDTIDEYKKHIKDRIKQHIFSATKLNVAKIKEDETFKSLGVDSLHALQLKNKLQEDFNMTISVAAIWQFPTVMKLSDFIAKELNLDQQYAAKAENSTAAVSVENKDIESEVKSLSLEELMKELSSKVE